MLRTGLVALLLAVLAPQSAAAMGGVMEIDMSPNEPASFGIRNVAAGATAILGGWNYWYKERVVEVETVPSDARLQLFFIRSNFQKRFERVDPPILVRLPSRIETTKKDSFAIRVAANGYSTREMSIKVNDVPNRLVIKLDPLPNSLVGLSKTHLAGRTTLTFRTTKEPELRVMKSRGFDGFTISMSETAKQLPNEATVSGGWIEGIEVAQAGEDLLVRIETKGSDIEARSKQTYDPVRREHVFAVDLLKEGTRRPNSQQVRAEFEAVPFSPGDACALAFENTIRSEMEADVISRGIRASGSVADVYRREAMLRLGRLDQGQVRTLDGEVLRTGSPIELELALQSGATVPGYIALLGEFARTQAEPALTMRSLIAPEMDPQEFEAIYRKATDARRSCGG